MILRPPVSFLQHRCNELQRGHSTQSATAATIKLCPPGHALYCPIDVSAKAAETRSLAFVNDALEEASTLHPLHAWRTKQAQHTLPILVRQ